MIEVKDLCCNYGDIKVLENIMFDTKKGESIGIIGPNGSGKSTLLKAMSKLIKPDSGRVVLCEKNISDISYKELARDMAVVPQDTNVDFDFTGYEIVLMGRNPHMKQFEIEGKKDFDIVKEAMDLTGTWQLRERKISELSGGERQRIIIARALAQEPKVLLLDEPVSHLDINHQIEILDLVSRLKKDKNILVITVLHDLNLAARYCDRLILLFEHKVMSIGTPEYVLTKENIQKAFRTNVIVRRHPLTGFIYMTLLNTIEIKERKAGKTIHIISGAGTGTQLMYTLLSKGYEVTAGVLNVLDSDHDTATMLNIKAISEAPFSPITPEAYSQNLEAMNKADIIVVSDVPVGWGNLKNIQALEEISGKKPVILLIPDMQENKDFTGGEASKIISKIFSKGARKTSDIKGMIDLIEDISGRAS